MPKFLSNLLKEKTIIIGGGIAALLAAKVLSSYFRQVLIIEKDSYSEKALPRNGVPQSHHIHILLIKGKQILSEFFPNLEANLISKGAHKIDLLADVKYYLATGIAMRLESGLSTLACTRPLLENTIRDELLTNYQNVQFLDNAKVVDLLFDHGNNKVIGVNTHSSNSYHKFYGKLIVDASGRRSETAKWLEEIGLKPKEIRISSYIGYTTKKFEIPNDFKFDYKALIVLTKPPVNPRMAVVYPVENNNIMIGLLGLGKTYPPTDNEGFIDFARKIGVKELDEILKNLKPISPIFGYRERSSRQYLYEKIEGWPENFIVVGDSVCAFNPFYGQGITVAAICAKALDEYLKKYGKSHLEKGFAKRFQKKIAKVNSFPWLLGSSEDLRWPTTGGPSSNFVIRLMQRYVNEVMLLGPESEIATRSFFAMMHLLKSPIVLFHPKIMIQLFSNKVIKKLLHI